MKYRDIEGLVDGYLEENWGAMVKDIDGLVRIESVENRDEAAPNAPFGPGPRRALTAALELSERMGFVTHDAEGYLGFADLPGESETQLGVIGHVDVVPAGEGWSFEPYRVTKKDGFLMGRGVVDDKGPMVLALHAARFWMEQGRKFPYTLRFIFGANEETGMSDIEYFHKHYEDPAFIITPDAEFPVCYGEKGGYDGTLTSAPIRNRVVQEMSGGLATNAVPGTAEAVVAVAADGLPAAKGIEVSPEGKGASRIRATGKSAHAANPETGVSAIGVLVDYLVENDVCTPREREFFEVVQLLAGSYDGSGVGIQTADDYFGPLTVIAGTISLVDDCFKLTIDSRFPTSITPDAITHAFTRIMEAQGGTFENTLLMEPFLVKPDSPEIETLISVYNEVTGEKAEPFTMGGGTYAREFSRGASFGPEKPWVEQPEWVGAIHGPNEGMSEVQMKETFKIYVAAIGRLMELEL